MTQPIESDPQPCEIPMDVYLKLVGRDAPPKRRKAKVMVGSFVCLLLALGLAAATGNSLPKWTGWFTGDEITLEEAMERAAMGSMGDPNAQNNGVSMVIQKVHRAMALLQAIAEDPAQEYGVASTATLGIAHVTEAGAKRFVELSKIERLEKATRRWAEIVIKILKPATLGDQGAVK